MKTRGIAVFLMVILAAFLSSCAVADKAATSWLNRNGAAQEVSPAPALDQESEPSANTKFIAADKHKEMKLIAGKKPFSSRSVVKAKGESTQEEAPNEASGSKRSGLLGWYMDAVDKSPLNPLRMKGRRVKTSQPSEGTAKEQMHESDQAEASNETSGSKRSGLIGWYMDMVDNSPLNPLNMKGANGRLPAPVEDAMEGLGMKKN